MAAAVWRKGLLLGLVGLLLAGCAGKRPPPVVEERGRPPAASTTSADASATEHVVAAGETLYAIALRYDKDYRELARINGINPQTFLIRPGQRLKLSGPPAPPAVVSTPAPAAARPAPPRPPASSPAPAATPTPSSAAAPAPTAPTGQAAVAKSQPSVSPPSGGGSPPARASTGLSWAWPAQGTLLSRFGAPGISGKGVDIAGRRGDSVRAAADGTVVYAGTGLVGYGKLLILRHDDNYISAYAHNDRFLVAEGERVTQGQPIAQIGATGTDRDKLHFEIREGGKPVDPLRFLPGRD